MRSIPKNHRKYVEIRSYWVPTFEKLLQDVEQVTCLHNGIIGTAKCRNKKEMKSKKCAEKEQGASAVRCSPIDHKLEV